MQAGPQAHLARAGMHHNQPLPNHMNPITQQRQPLQEVYHQAPAAEPHQQGTIMAPPRWPADITGNFTAGSRAAGPCHPHIPWPTRDHHPAALRHGLQGGPVSQQPGYAQPVPPPPPPTAGGGIFSLANGTAIASSSSRSARLAALQEAIKSDYALPGASSGRSENAQQGAAANTGCAAPAQSAAQPGPVQRQQQQACGAAAEQPPAAACAAAGGAGSLFAFANGRTPNISTAARQRAARLVDHDWQAHTPQQQRQPDQYGEPPLAELANPPWPSAASTMAPNLPNDAVGRTEGTLIQADGGVQGLHAGQAQKAPGAIPEPHLPQETVALAVSRGMRHAQAAAEVGDALPAATAPEVFEACVAAGKGGAATAQAAKPPSAHSPAPGVPHMTSNSLTLGTGVLAGLEGASMCMAFDTPPGSAPQVATSSAAAAAADRDGDREVLANNPAAAAAGAGNAAAHRDATEGDATHLDGSAAGRSTDGSAGDDSSAGAMPVFQTGTGKEVIVLAARLQQARTMLCDDEEVAPDDDGTQSCVDQVSSMVNDSKKRCSANTLRCTTGSATPILPEANEACTAGDHVVFHSCPHAGSGGKGCGETAAWLGTWRRTSWRCTAATTAGESCVGNRQHRQWGLHHSVPDRHWQSCCCVRGATKAGSGHARKCRAGPT